MFSVHHILLIDDDAEEYLILREAISAVNEKLSISYCSGYNFSISRKSKKPDIIFLDINLTLKNGFTILRYIRTSDYKDIPVIMYTTTNNPRDVLKAYELGANLFFTKPDQFSNLVGSLDKIVHLDWQYPDTITRSFFKKGHFIPFQYYC